MRSVATLVTMCLLALPLGCSRGGGEAGVTPRDFTGTWRLNREASDIPAVTQSQVLTMATDGVRIAMRETLVNDSGDTLTITVEGKLDGTDTPVTGTPFATTVAYRLLAPDTIEGIAKKDGVVVVKETAVLADDGQSVRVTYLSFDGEGHSVTSHAVFERVNPE